MNDTVKNSDLSPSRALHPGKSTESKGDISEEKIEYDEKQPLSGVFARIAQYCLGNPHTKDVIYVTASTTLGNHPSQVLDNFWQSHWVSDNSPDQWIKFDMKQTKVSVTHYVIKTINYVSGGNHLKSWVFEGSSNDNDWIELDKRQSTNDLNDRSAVACFKTKLGGIYRYYRLRQIGPSHCESHMMALTNIELFGSLRMDPSV